MPLEFPFCEGKDIVGIIGYEFIKEFVVEINYERRTISLFEPASFKYRGHAKCFRLLSKARHASMRV